MIIFALRNRTASLCTAADSFRHGNKTAELLEVQEMLTKPYLSNYTHKMWDVLAVRNAAICGIFVLLIMPKFIELYHA